MSRDVSINKAASIRQRLLNIAREQGEPFDTLLNSYAHERMLYRLSCSEWCDQFLLKGAALFSLWYDTPHRPTRDVDFLGIGDIDAERLESIFQELCGITVEDDGMEFDTGSIRVQEIREQNRYQGFRVRFVGTLDNARTTVQFDIGFGDSVVPEPEEVQYPTLLDMQAPTLKAYSVYTVIAEKLQTIVDLGMANSRMKDFYDLYVLMQSETLDQKSLQESVQATFERRGTHIPTEIPIAMTSEFYNDEIKIRDWQAFLRRNSLDESIILKEVIVELQKYFMPIFAST